MSFGVERPVTSGPSRDALRFYFRAHTSGFVLNFFGFFPLFFDHISFSHSPSLYFFPHFSASHEIYRHFPSTFLIRNLIALYPLGHFRTISCEFTLNKPDEKPQMQNPLWVKKRCNTWDTSSFTILYFYSRFLHKKERERK